jgi:regulatory protein
MYNPTTVRDAIQKLEHFCAYQERCHKEVIQKMRSIAVDSAIIDEIVVHLIQNNYLNEERFACSFARGKHRIKNWGKTRISNELKLRNISQYNITTALKEITQEDYTATFHLLAERHWENSNERNTLKKRKKFCDFLLRKGFESNLVYEKVKELEKLDT